MQAALQPYVDSAISKTINCPEAMSFAAFRDVYLEAYDKGLKGCTTYRPNPVTGAVLVAGTPSTTGSAAAAVPVGPGSKWPPLTSPLIPAKKTDPALQVVREDNLRPSDVVYLSKPLERDTALEGFTYKIKWPASPHALYVTINDIDRDGRRRPFEIFINTKNLEHYAWTVALTRMISAVFRRGGDVSFVAEELKAVFDPEGGRWMEGRYVPSLLAAIGDVIEEHMIRIGFLLPEAPDSAVEETAGKRQTATLAATRTEASGVSSEASEPAPGAALSSHLSTHLSTQARYCPRCGNRSLHRIEGCWTCASCQYSHCG